MFLDFWWRLLSVQHGCQAPCPLFFSSIGGSLTRNCAVDRRSRLLRFLYCWSPLTFCKYFSCCWLCSFNTFWCSLIFVFTCVCKLLWCPLQLARKFKNQDLPWGIWTGKTRISHLWITCRCLPCLPIICQNFLSSRSPIVFPIPQFFHLSIMTKMLNKAV